MRARRGRARAVRQKATQWLPRRQSATARESEAAAAKAIRAYARAPRWRKKPCRSPPGRQFQARKRESGAPQFPREKRYRGRRKRERESPRRPTKIKDWPASCRAESRKARQAPCAARRASDWPARGRTTDAASANRQKETRSTASRVRSGAILRRWDRKQS